MRIFDYVVFYTPNKDNAEKGDKATIIEEGRLLEKDAEIAKLKVTRLIPSEYDEKLDQVVIAVRPF